MHLATKILLATLALVVAGGVFWRVVDSRRARRHRQRRLAREEREREESSMAQAVGAEFDPEETGGDVLDAEVVREANPEG